MGLEIERKFLVRGDAWRDGATVLAIRQGYLAVAEDCTVRVRISGNAAWLTVKGKRTGGATPEFEYAIPVPQAVTMLDTMARKPLIEKNRHLVAHGNRIWEVDEFFGDNAGLILAERELDSPDEAVSLPPWAGREVTGEKRFYNARMVEYPYRDWREDEKS
jgi:adenylate cyclase